MSSITADRGRRRSRHRSERRSEADKRRDLILTAFFVTGAGSIIFLQKLAAPIGDSFAEAPLVFVNLGLAGLAAAGLLRIDRLRAILCAIFVVAAALSSLINASNVSVSSFALVMVLYIPLIFTLEVSRRKYVEMIGYFQNMMAAICVLVFIQYAIEITFGASSMPSMDSLLPSFLQYPGFTYLRPMEMFHSLLKANGFFMLEVSFVSQFIAIAIILEVIYSAKMWRLALFSAALIATFAGTGLLLLLLMAPTLLLRSSPRVVAGVTVVLVLGVVFASQTHWFSVVLSRADEINHYNGSAHHRFIEPLSDLVEFVVRGNGIFFGMGAGSVAKNLALWPLTKVTIEYGLVTLLAFYSFFAYSMFQSPPDRRVSMAIFLMYNFLDGSFAVPVLVYMCLLFCTLFVIKKRKPKTGTRRRRSRRRSATLPEIVEINDLGAELGGATAAGGHLEREPDTVDIQNSGP